MLYKTGISPGAMRGRTQLWCIWTGYSAIEWDLMFNRFNLHALSSSLSDHCPLLLCQHARPKARDSFHFENFWPRIPGFMEVVQMAWQESVPGISPLNILYYKLQHTAKALRKWSKKLFGKA
jgi:hypothetical protein